MWCGGEALPEPVSPSTQSSEGARESGLDGFLVTLHPGR